MPTHGASDAAGPHDTGHRATVRKLPTRPQALRVLVVDDHQTVADLLVVALRYESDIECVGRAASAAEAVALAEHHQPDVVLMDLSLPDMDGLQATAIITAAHPEMRVILLTAATDPRLVAQAASAGACAFVPKSAALEVLLDAIRGARNGAMIVDPSVLTALVELGQSSSQQQERQVGMLTAREQDVLGLLGTGLDVRRVAQELGISQNTCRGHVKSVLAKLDCHSQLEAVVVATRLGLLDLPRDRAAAPEQAKAPRRASVPEQGRRWGASASSIPRSTDGWSKQA
jgi:DNA-binding NarL/FixJ family response regulator